LCVASAAAAQGWEAGAKSGIDQTSISRSTEFDWSRTPTSALFFKKNIGGPFSIQPELAHVRRTGISTVAGTALTLTADYVEVPNARGSGWSVLGGLSVPLYRTRRMPPVWMPPRAVMAAPSAPAVSRSEPLFVAPGREASRNVVTASTGRHVTLTADNVDVR